MEAVLNSCVASFFQRRGPGKTTSWYHFMAALLTSCGDAAQLLATCWTSPTILFLGPGGCGEAWECGLGIL